jgi:hypothetical protein
LATVGVEVNLTAADMSVTPVIRRTSRSAARGRIAMEMDRWEKTWLTGLAIMALVLLTMAGISAARASGQCPANPDDPVGQLLCGETDCTAESAWTGRGCRPRGGYWCCGEVAGGPRPTPKWALTKGFSVRLFDKQTRAPVGTEFVGPVRWQVIGLRHVIEDVEQAGIGKYEDGVLTTERGAVRLGGAECGP